MIGVRGRTVDNTKAVRRKVKIASYKSLGHAGGSMRKTASRMVKRRKKPSAPGQAPSTQTGHLKRVLRYEVDRNRDSVRMGPVNKYRRTIWDRLEFGGRFKPTRYRLKAKRHRVGEFGPIRRGRMETKITKSGAKRRTRYADQYQRVRLRTKAQARRADRLIRAENARRLIESQKAVQYAARPLMGPTLAKTKSRLPASWRGSVR